MSTSTEATEATETDEQTTEVPEGTEAVTDPQETTEDEQGDEDTGNREAAKYRTRLRATEVERDTLTEQVDAMRRAEVERLAGATVQNPSALWAADIKVADLLGEDGTIDPEKVKAAATQAAETLGLARPRPGNVAPKEGSNPKSAPQDDMASVIRG